MTIRPEDLIQHGRDLLENAQDETAHRVAARTIYYGCFHVAREVADNLEIPVPGDARGDAKAAGRHEAVYQRLKNPQSSLAIDVRTALMQMGELMFQMRDYRARADYRLSDDFRSEDAQTVNEISKKIVKLQTQVDKHIESANKGSV